MSDTPTTPENEVFPRGAENPFGRHFTGRNYLHMLSTDQITI